MYVAIALILVAAGTVLFHVLSPWWWTPIASNWTLIDLTVDLTFWITGIAFVAIILFMAYCAVRYRYSARRRAEYEPENRKLEIWLTAGTSVAIIALLTPGLFAWADFVRPPDDAVEIEVLGEQWTWSFRHPGEDGEFGAASARLMSFENPFGIDPDDPRGQDDILIETNELYLLLNQPVKLLLRSKDVLHNFKVPQFRAKMDMVPGMVTFFWLTPTRPGRFEVLCAELCGVAHYAMRGHVVVVEDESEYREWLEGFSTFAEMQAAAEADRRSRLAQAP
jgi:cytochrome c oxidase subunit II